MKRETLRSLKDLAYYSSVGLSISLSIFVGLGIGVYLDNRFHTNPSLTLVGLAMGIVAVGAVFYTRFGTSLPASLRDWWQDVLTALGAHE